MATASHPGRFNDGRSAASHTVTVRQEASRLEIRGGDGTLVALWRIDQLHNDGTMADGRIRLRCRADPDARLTVAASYRPPVGAGEAVKSRRWLFLLALACGSAMLTALYLAMPLGARWLAARVPPAMEMSWGTEMAEGMQRQFGRCGGEPGQELLAELTARLAAGLPAERRNVTVRVLDLPVPNAFALPGGQIVILHGMLSVAQNADELAGVLAHELTHIGERHATAAMIRSIGVGALAAMLVGDASGLAANGAAVIFASSYSREDEAAADRGALRLLARAGIGNVGFADVLERIERNEPAAASVPNWISDHPGFSERLSVIRAAADHRPEPALPKDQWAAVKWMCLPP